MASIVVDNNGTQLGYYDSGVPSGIRPGASYMTIVAIHGMVFSSPVFSRLMERGKASGVRVVAVNRRDYPGSTPFSDEDKRVLNSGTDAERAAFLREQGVEIATFVDRLIEKNGLPPLSADKKSGGVQLMGWSFGATLAMAALANLDALPEASQTRLAAHLRSLILFEAPTVAIGSYRPEKLWSPVIDTTIAEEKRIPAFVPWISSYFNHGDLDSQKDEVLEYYVPALDRAPSVYNMTPKEQESAIFVEQGGTDMLFMFFLEPQIQDVYKRAIFDKATRARYPNVKIAALCGDTTSPHGIPAFWSMRDDNKANGGDAMQFKWVKGGNHFYFWDEPQKMLDHFLEFA